MFHALEGQASRKLVDSNPLTEERLGRLRKTIEQDLPEIYDAARRGDCETIRRHLDETIHREGHNRCVDRRCLSTGRNMLHEAAIHGHKPVVDMLCGEYGADVHARTVMGKDTALHFAASKNRRQICFWLVTVFGADPNMPNKYHWTPLHYAAEHASLSTIKTLILYGARTTHKNEDGHTPVNLAIQRGASNQMVDFLLKASEEHERVAFNEDLDAMRRDQQELAAIRDKEVRTKRDKREREVLEQARLEYDRWRRGDPEPEPKPEPMPIQGHMTMHNPNRFMGAS